MLLKDLGSKFCMRPHCLRAAYNLGGWHAIAPYCTPECKQRDRARVAARVVSQRNMQQMSAGMSARMISQKNMQRLLHRQPAGIIDESPVDDDIESFEDSNSDADSDAAATPPLTQQGPRDDAEDARRQELRSATAHATISPRRVNITHLSDEARQLRAAAEYNRASILGTRMLAMENPQKEERLRQHMMEEQRRAKTLRFNDAAHVFAESDTVAPWKHHRYPRVADLTRLEFSKEMCEHFLWQLGPYPSASGTSMVFETASSWWGEKFANLVRLTAGHELAANRRLRRPVHEAVTAMSRAWHIMARYTVGILLILVHDPPRDRRGRKPTTKDTKVLVFNGELPTGRVSKRTSVHDPNRSTTLGAALRALGQMTAPTCGNVHESDAFQLLCDQHGNTQLAISLLGQAATIGN